MKIRLSLVALAIVLAFSTTCLAGSVSGRATDSNSNPLAGVVIVLASSSAARIITTDSSGNYTFSNVTENTFYVIAPFLANYTFLPSSRGLSLGSGNAAGQDFSGTLGTLTESPLDTPEFFVRQQYVDLLKHEPDEGGLNFWSADLKACTTQACKYEKRRNIMCAFIASGEYQGRFTGTSITVCQ